MKYGRSFFGFLWTIIAPLATAAIYYFVFKTVMKVDRPFYLPFILCGVLPWSFFAQSINESTESITGNQGLITKIPVPLHVFPYVVTLTNFSTLVLALPIIFLLALLSGISPSLEMLWVFYFFFCLLLMSYTLGAMLAMFYVYLRDLKHAINLILQIWFYATPIVYDESMIPEKYRFITYLNPVGSIFSGIHESMLGSSGNLYIHVGVSALWCAVTLFFLRITHARLKTGLVEIL